MRKLVIGDIHYKGNDDDKLFNSLIKNIYNDLQFSSVVLLGDVIDNPNKLNVNLFNQLFDLFRFFHNNNVNLTILTGNHDLIQGVNFLDMINISNNIRIVSEPYVEFIDGYLDVYIPYHNDLPNEKDVIEKLKETFISNYLKNKEHINLINIYTHNQYKENSTGFSKSLNEYYEFIFNIKDVNINVISGHIHKHILKKINNNVKLYNIGCAIARSFNDYIDDNVLYLFINQQNIDEIKINSSDNKYNIKLPIYKTFNIYDDFNRIFNILDDNSLILADNIYININIDDGLLKTVSIDNKQKFFDKVAYINKIYKNKIKYSIKQLSTVDDNYIMSDNFEDILNIDIDKYRSIEVNNINNIIFDIIDLAIKNEKFNIKKEDIINFINEYSEILTE